MKLEKFSDKDKGLYKKLVFNEEAMKMNLGRAFTKEEAEMFFQAVLEQNAEDGVLGFYKVCVSDSGEDEFIGMGALSDNEEYGAVEIEYMLLPKFWNRGLGTELVKKLIAMSKDSGYEKVVAITDPDNTYSKRILAKEGFSLTKEYVNDDGEPAELYMM